MNSSKEQHEKTPGALRHVAEAAVWIGAIVAVAAVGLELLDSE